MAGSPIRAPFPNLSFSPPSEIQPPSIDTTSPSGMPVTSSNSPRQVPTFPRFADGDGSLPPPLKKQRTSNGGATNPNEAEDFSITSQNHPTHDCSSESPRTAASMSPKEGATHMSQNGSSVAPSPSITKTIDSVLPKDLSSQRLLPNLPWGGFLPDGYPRLPMFPKNLAPIFGQPISTTPPLPPTTSPANDDPMPLGASALAAAAAMAMSPLFQTPPGQRRPAGGATAPWNPVFAAAAAAFASGRFPPPPPPQLQPMSHPKVEDEGKDGGSSSRSGTPLPLSGAVSPIEGCLEALPDSGQAGHHWTFQEQFKQLYELSHDPKRKEFLDDLFNFMQKRGSPVNRIPIMAKQVLDLYELYRLVVTRGGLVEVINKKLWREITKGLQLPSSITSAAFTLRTQYMKYLYPYECDKLGLSSPGELQAAIDGNRREARRSSYTFDYPMLPTSANQQLSNTPPVSSSFGNPASHYPLLPPQGPHAPPLLPPGLLLPPGFPHQPNVSTPSTRHGGLFPDPSIFGFPSLSSTVVPPPTMSPLTAFGEKRKSSVVQPPQRCLSSSSATMIPVGGDTSPKPRPNSKPNYSSPATLESEFNEQSKMAKFLSMPKGTTTFDLERPDHLRAGSSPSPKPFQPCGGLTESHQASTAAARFAEFLKHRLPQSSDVSIPPSQFQRDDIMQSVHRQFIQEASTKFPTAEKKDQLNGCADDRRSGGLSVSRDSSSHQAHKSNGQVASNEHQSTSLQIAPNLRISTQSGSQLGLPENTLVVCMEVTGVVYQGVLFGQAKSSVGERCI